MAKRRLHELAKERGLTARDVIQALESAGIEAKSALSTVEEVTVEDALKKAGLNAKPKKAASKPAASAGAAQDGAPGVGQWIRLRRRRRQLRRLHESQLKDLAGLACTRPARATACAAARSFPPPTDRRTSRRPARSSPWSPSPPRGY